MVLEVKNLSADSGDLGSIPGLGRSHGGDNPLQYSCLENPMDGGAWHAMIHRAAKSGTLRKQLCTHTGLERAFRGHIQGNVGIKINDDKNALSQLNNIGNQSPSDLSKLITN